MILDGLNEKGLNVVCFLFPGYAQYTRCPSKGKESAPGARPSLAPGFSANFATLEEGQGGLKNVGVTDPVDQPAG